MYPKKTKGLSQILHLRQTQNIIKGQAEPEEKSRFSLFIAAFRFGRCAPFRLHRREGARDKSPLAWHRKWI